MTPPRRIVNDAGASPEAVELVRSTLEDAPSDAARRRTLAALGLAGSVAASPAAHAAPAAGPDAARPHASSLWPTIARWVAVGAAGVGVIVAGLHARDLHSVAPAPPAATPVPVLAYEAAPEPAPAPETTPDPTPPPVPTPEPGHAGAPPAPAVSGKPSSLADEVEMLAAARRLLQAGDGGGALAALDRYGAKAPRGALRTEASVLRVEALRLEGRRGSAVALAKRLLAAPGGAAYAQRLRSLLPELAEP